MTTDEIIRDKRDVKTLTDAELKESLKFFTSNKIWAGRYFPLDHEMQQRATRRWVREDVFGHTFTGSK